VRGHRTNVGTERETENGGLEQARRLRRWAERERDRDDVSELGEAKRGISYGKRLDVNAKPVRVPLMLFGVYVSPRARRRTRRLGRVLPLREEEA